MTLQYPRTAHRESIRPPSPDWLSYARCSRTLSGLRSGEQWQIAWASTPAHYWQRKSWRRGSNGFCSPLALAVRHLTLTRSRPGGRARGVTVEHASQLVFCNITQTVLQPAGASPTGRRRRRPNGPSVALFSQRARMYHTLFGWTAGVSRELPGLSVAVGGIRCILPYKFHGTEISAAAFSR